MQQDRQMCCQVRRPPGLRGGPLRRLGPLGDSHRAPRQVLHNGHAGPRPLVSFFT